MKGRDLYLQDKFKPLCVVFLLVVLALLCFYPHRIITLLHYKPYTNICGAAVRVITFAIAIPTSIAFLNVCYNTPWCVRQGRLSMQYYIYHALVIPGNTALMVPPLIMIACKLNMPMNFVTAVIIIISTVVGLSIILKIPYIKMLTNPSLIFEKNTNTIK